MIANELTGGRSLADVQAVDSGRGYHPAYRGLLYVVIDPCDLLLPAIKMVWWRIGPCELRGTVTRLD